MADQLKDVFLILLITLLLIQRSFSFRDVTFFKCNLKERDFVSAKLYGAKFIDCNLQETQFYSADLTGVSFHGSELQNAVFYSYNGDTHRHCNPKSLEAKALAGTNLLGATLPPYLGEDFKAPLDAEKDAVANARNLFVILLPLCFYVFAAATFSDVACGDKTGGIPFLFTGFKLPLGEFIALSSVAITALYIYFHLYLQKVWDQLSYLPAIFPNGAPLWDRVSPWMFGVLTWEHIPKLKERLEKENNNKSRSLYHGAPRNYWWQWWACAVLGYGAPVGVLMWLFYPIYSPYAARSPLHKFCSSFIAARLAAMMSLYLRAKWFVAVLNCNISSLQNAIIDANI